MAVFDTAFNAEPNVDEGLTKRRPILVTVDIASNNPVTDGDPVVDPVFDPVVDPVVDRVFGRVVDCVFDPVDGATLRF